MSRRGPAAVLRVHRDHCRDARGERRGEQLVRRRNQVGATEALGLVGDDLMAAVDSTSCLGRCRRGGLSRSCSSEGYLLLFSRGSDPYLALIVPDQAQVSIWRNYPIGSITTLDNLAYNDVVVLWWAT